VPAVKWAAGWLLWRDFKGRKIQLAEALRDLKEFGADGIEFTPRPGELEAMGLTLDAVSRRIRDSGLAVSGHYFSGPFLDSSQRDALLKQAAETFASLKAFGARHMVVGPPPPPPAGEDRLEAIAKMAPLVNELGRRAAVEGIEVGLHPHLNTLIETPEETDRFMELADPTLVGLALDTGHYHLAGGDALKALAKHGSRLNYLHFKDAVRPFKRPDFLPNLRELGRGEVDFPGVMRALKALKYTGWIDVEQDFTSTTPRESCRTSMGYVHGVLNRI
jgi:sugar phosphate isomerase/epimerase